MWWNHHLHLLERADTEAGYDQYGDLRGVMFECETVIHDDLDFVVTDDAYIDFDREGQFVPFDLAPDSYQVWSIKTPDIAVVVCLPAND